MGLHRVSKHLLLYPTRHCELLYFSSIRVLLLANKYTMDFRRFFQSGVVSDPSPPPVGRHERATSGHIVTFFQDRFCYYRNVLLSVVILSILFVSLFTAVFNVKV